ncbi:MAG: hypothetical protein R6U36_02845 [Candidatus Fermentibacteraceae bacterium]
MRVLAVLALVAAAAFAADVARVDVPGGSAPSDDDLTYFDGTSWWLTWGGLYRGTWFNTEDFYGAAESFVLEESEMWFYHHSSYPWDTSDVYFEVYNGDQSAPVDELDQTQTTATHYSPTTVTYDPTVGTEANFWVIANTELSSGGWPAILGDNTPSDVSHSFFSDDFIVWEPWIIQGPNSNDYEIYATGVPEEAFDSATWGSIKTLY